MKAGAFTPATHVVEHVVDAANVARSMKAGAFTPATPPAYSARPAMPGYAQ